MKNIKKWSGMTMIYAIYVIGNLKNKKMKVKKLKKKKCKRKYALILTKKEIKKLNKEWFNSSCLDGFDRYCKILDALCDASNVHL